MQQPHDAPWFLRDSSEGGHTQPPNYPSPGFPDPSPQYSFEPSPQHEFSPSQPEPQHQPRGFPSPYDLGDDEKGERSLEKGLFHHDKPQPQHPPPVPNNQPPASGFRFPLDSNAVFPSKQSGHPVSTDADRVSGVFVGSAIFNDSVHPCKIVPSLRPPCRVAYGGGELEHNGRYDLLPITPDMEWVPTMNGELPPGRRLVEGGYESSGAKLYHALGVIDGVKVPGKTAGHLGGANIPFGGYEHVVKKYEILCWR